MGLTSFIIVPYGGDRGSRAGCKTKKCDVFCLFFATLWNDEVCDNGNAM